MASSNANGSKLSVTYNAYPLAVLAKLHPKLIYGAKERATLELLATPRNPPAHILAHGVHLGDKVLFTHTWVKGKHVTDIGREFCSLQQYRREVRGLLFGGRYTEYDLVNCQPTIMLTWAARKYGLALPTLRLYAAGCPAFIKLLGDTTVWRRAATNIEAVAKELVVRLCFGGSIYTFETDLCCTLMGPGKAFAQGVERDVTDLMAAFVADKDLFAFFEEADLKPRPSPTRARSRRVAASKMCSASTRSP